MREESAVSVRDAGRSPRWAAQSHPDRRRPPGCLVHSVCVSVKGSYSHGWLCVVTLIIKKLWKKIPKGIEIF